LQKRKKKRSRHVLCDVGPILKLSGGLLSDRGPRTYTFEEPPINASPSRTIVNPSRNTGWPIMTFGIAIPYPRPRGVLPGAAKNSSGKRGFLRTTAKSKRLLSGGLSGLDQAKRTLPTGYSSFDHSTVPQNVQGAADVRGRHPRVNPCRVPGSTN